MNLMSYIWRVSSGITVMCRLTTGIRSDKCVIRRFRRCANLKECTYTNLDTIAYYTPRLWYSLLLLGYKPVQHVTVLNTVRNCNTMVSIIILYYFITIRWDHRRKCGPSLCVSAFLNSVIGKIRNANIPSYTNI